MTEEQQSIEFVPSASSDDPATRLARINEAFDRGEADHDQVDAVEREVSHAAREVRREQSVAERAQKARVAAEKVQNSSKLQALVPVRKQYASEILGHLHAIRSAHTEISQRTALIDSVLDRDSKTVDQANAYAVALGLRPSARSVNRDELRLALGIWLAGDRSRPKTTCTRDAALPMTVLLAELSNETLSPAARAEVVRLAIEAYVVATASSDVSDWTTLRFAPSAFLAHTPSAAKFKRAQALLAALLQHGDQK